MQSEGSWTHSQDANILVFFARVMDKHLPKAIGLLFDIIINPLFHNDDIEKEKKVVLEEIHMYMDEPAELVNDIFIDTIWKGHPLGQPILGNENVMKSPVLLLV